jgi:iron complex outermembrane receptor protein
MNAQTIKGIVTDENGQALPYSNVVDKATANGVTTDGNGNFEIRVTGLPVTLIAKYVGFQNKSIEVTNSAATIVFKLDPNNSLDEVVVTGNRSKCEAYSTQLFLLYAEDLKSSGQVTFDKMLAYKIRPLIQ